MAQTKKKGCYSCPFLLHEFNRNTNKAMSIILSIEEAIPNDKPVDDRLWALKANLADILAFRFTERERRKELVKLRRDVEILIERLIF